MKIYIFTKKEAALKGAFPKKDTEFFAPGAAAKHSPDSGDVSYLDVSGLSAAELKKAAALLNKRCKVWGIIDPKGSDKDPAHWFFDGASDYIGSAPLKSGINAKRLKSVPWRLALGGAEPAVVEKTAKRGIKLPPAKDFPGWKHVSSGSTIPSYLLYASLQGKTAINSRLGENAYAQLYKKLLAFLHKNFQEAEGLLWMETGKDCLFLIPPKAKCAEAAVTACVRMLISAPQIAIETFGLNLPVSFSFALHYGNVSFKPPGKTGTVISDSVNFIFHLGAKRAEIGRLTVSDEIPDVSIPESLDDLFVKAGDFEGRQLRHTKKFSYPQAWI